MRPLRVSVFLFPFRVNFAYKWVPWIPNLSTAYHFNALIRLRIVINMYFAVCNVMYIVARSGRSSFVSEWFFDVCISVPRLLRNYRSISVVPFNVRSKKEHRKGIAIIINRDKGSPAVYNERKYSYTPSSLRVIVLVLAFWRASGLKFVQYEHN